VVAAAIFLVLAAGAVFFGFAFCTMWIAMANAHRDTLIATLMKTE